MISFSIKAVFIDVIMDSGYYGITINVHYFSGRSARYAFSNMAFDRLPLTSMVVYGCLPNKALSSVVPRSVSSFIDRCICLDYVTITSGGCSYSYMIGEVFKPIKAAAHA